MEYRCPRFKGHNWRTLCAVAILAGALAGCAGADVAVNAPDGSARGFCQTGIFGVPTLCFVHPAAGEFVVRGANGSEDASAFLSGAGAAAGGAGGLLFGARYRPDVSITDASAAPTMQGSRTTIGGSHTALSLSSRSIAESRASAHARAVARQRQAQHQHEMQRQHEEQHQKQEQRQRQEQKQKQREDQWQKQHQHQNPPDNQGW